MNKNPAVYILSNKKNGTLYIGMTTNIIRRIWEHKHGFVDGFSRKYSLDKLVWFEFAASIEDAAGREIQMKRWKREWKIRIIEEKNPEWNDLYDTLSE